MVGAVEAWAAVVAPEFPPALSARLGRHYERAQCRLAKLAQQRVP
jgi:hypothetical protein